MAIAGEWFESDQNEKTLSFCGYFNENLTGSTHFF